MSNADRVRSVIRDKPSGQPGTNGTTFPSIPTAAPPLFECRQCDLKFKTQEALGNHKQKFCVGSGYENPDGVRASLQHGRHIAAGADLSRHNVMNSERAEEIVRQAAPGHAELAAKFAQRDFEMKRVQHALETGRVKTREELAAGLKVRQYEMMATLEKDARKMQELQRSVDEQKQKEMVARREKSKIASKLHEIETERLQLLEESKTTELAAMQKEMEMLQQREASKKEEISAIEKRLVHKAGAKMQARKEVTEQLGEVGKKRDAAVLSQQQQQARRHGESIGDLKAKQKNLADRRAALDAAQHTVNAQRAEIGQGEERHGKRIGDMGRQEMLLRLKRDIELGPMAMRQEQELRQRDINKAKQDSEQELEAVTALMGSAEARALQRPFSKGQDVSEHLGLNPLQRAHELEHELMVDGANDMVKGVSDLMADVLIPGFENEVLDTEVAQHINLRSEEREAQRAQIRQLKEDVLLGVRRGVAPTPEATKPSSKPRAAQEASLSKRAPETRTENGKPKRSSKPSEPPTQPQPTPSAVRRENTSQQVLEVRGLRRDYLESGGTDQQVLDEFDQLERDAMQGGTAPQGMQAAGMQNGFMGQQEPWGANTTAMGGNPMVNPQMMGMNPQMMGMNQQMMGGNPMMNHMGGGAMMGGNPMMMNQMMMGGNPMMMNQMMGVQMGMALNSNLGEENRRLRGELGMFNASQAGGTSAAGPGAVDHGLRRQLAELTAKLGTIQKEADPGGGLSEEEKRHRGELERMRREAEKLENQQRLSKMAQEKAEAEDAKHKAVEQQRWIEEQRQRLLTKRIEKAMAMDTSQPQPTGFSIFFDYILGFTNRVMAASMVYCFMQDGAAKTSITSLESRITEMDGDSHWKKAVFKQDGSCPASLLSSRTLYAIIEVQHVTASPPAQGQPPKVVSMGWTLLPLFFPDGDLREGKWKLPCFRAPVNSLLKTPEDMTRQLTLVHDMFVYVRIVKTSDVQHQRTIGIDPGRTESYYSIVPGYPDNDPDATTPERRRSSVSFAKQPAAQPDRNRRGSEESDWTVATVPESEDTAEESRRGSIETETELSPMSPIDEDDDLAAFDEPNPYGDDQYLDNSPVQTDGVAAESPTGSVFGTASPMSALSPRSSTAHAGDSAAPSEEPSRREPRAAPPSRGDF